MRIDPSVARRKFDREVRRLSDARDDLMAWGCVLVRASYPHIDLMFVPRNPLAVTFPSGQTKNQLILFDRTAQVGEAKMISARAFGVRIGLDDYDARAPSVWFLDPFTWEPLHYDQMFRVIHAESGGPPMNLLLDGHPIFHRPFICIRGVREYHEHPQHSGDDWFLYRSSMSVVGLVQTLWRLCVRSMRPNLSIQTMKINWEARRN